MPAMDMMEDTAPALEDMDVEFGAMDESGGEDMDFDNLTSDIDSWDEEDSYDAYAADRDYLYGLLR